MSLPPITALVPVAQLVADALGGHVPDPASAVRALIGLGLELVPVEELRAHLDDAARARAEAAFTTAEEIKFGGAKE